MSSSPAASMRASTIPRVREGVPVDPREQAGQDWDPPEWQYPEKHRTGEFVTKI